MTDLNAQIVGLLLARDAETCRQAADALGRQGQAGVQALVELLESPDWRAVRRAQEAAGYLGWLHEPAICAQIVALANRPAPDFLQRRISLMPRKEV